MNELRIILKGVFDTLAAIRVHRPPRIRIDEVEEAERLVKRLETENNSQTGTPGEQTYEMRTHANPKMLEEACRLVERRENTRTLIKKLEDMKTRVNEEDREAIDNSIRQLNALL